jgi:hypothetical protein
LSSVSLGQKKRASRARTNFLRGLSPNAGLCVECLHRKKAHAWAAAPAARNDYSIGPVAARASETPVPGRLPRLLTRYWLLLPLVAGAALLIVAEFLPLYEIRTITTVPEGGRTSTGAHHGYALLVVGIAMLPMAVGAVRGGSRPAAFALLVLSAIALFVALAIDLPDLNETGLIGRTYDQAEARPRVGFFVETLGATLALLGSIGTLLFRPGR